MSICKMLVLNKNHKGCKGCYYCFLSTNTNAIPFSAPPKALFSTEKFEGNFVQMPVNFTPVC